MTTPLIAFHHWRRLKIGQFLDNKIRKMKASPHYTLQSINRPFPWIVLVLVVIFLLDSYRGWFILLIGLGGVWVFSLFWTRMLAAKLWFSREMRFGWAQV